MVSPGKAATSSWVASTARLHFANDSPPGNRSSWDSRTSSTHRAAEVRQLLPSSRRSRTRSSPLDDALPGDRCRGSRVRSIGDAQTPRRASTRRARAGLGFYGRPCRRGVGLGPARQRCPGGRGLTVATNKTSRDGGSSDVPSTGQMQLAPWATVSENPPPSSGALAEEVGAWRVPSTGRVASRSGAKRKAYEDHDYCLRRTRWTTSTCSSSDYTGGVWRKPHRADVPGDRSGDWFTGRCTAPGMRTSPIR